jgi:dihydroorotase-like cyclic amidohydrolase
MAQTVVHSVLLFDGKDVHKNATVTFDGRTGLITSVSTSTGGSHPADATVIDGSGHTLIPGLIESHMHCYDLHVPPGTDTSDVLKSTLKSGVTTACNMHAPKESANGLREVAAAELQKARNAGKDGRVTMSDLKSSHLGATIDGGWPKPIVLAGHPSPEV